MSQTIQTKFTVADLAPWAGKRGVSAQRENLIQIPAKPNPGEGYGNNLHTGFAINFEGKTIPIKAICWSNCATLFFKWKKETIFIH